MSRRSRRHFLQTSSSLAAFALLRTNPSFAAEADVIVRTADPYNAEPRLLALVVDQITPVKHFYVRNHGPMPQVEAKGFKLTIDGLVDKPQTFTLDDVKDRFSEISVEATLTCAGNRRQELSAMKAVGGVQWDAGAIGNATWTGVPLADVLTRANVKTSATHVWFDGLDPIKEKDGSVAPFGASIPLDRLWQTSPRRRQQAAILAYAMNGATLPAEHGFPLRSIVPGYIGARSVKWLTKITLSDRPSPNHYVAEAYKIVQSDAKDEAAAAEPIYDFPINAAICAPAAGATVKAGPTLLSGYALADGESAAKVEKVEVSADGGQTWTTARLIGASAPFTWQHWTADLDLKPGKHELIVRASDTAGHTMPKTGGWNFKGYLNNGWHRVQVEAV